MGAGVRHVGARQRHHQLFNLVEPQHIARFDRRLARRLGDGFFVSRFRERFESKGRFRGYLEAIPTALIIDTLAALSGAALAIEQLAPA